MNNLFNSAIVATVQSSQDAWTRCSTIGSEMLTEDTSTWLSGIYNLFLSCDLSDRNAIAINYAELTEDLRIFYAYGLIGPSEFSKVLLLMLSKVELDFKAGVMGDVGTYSARLVIVVLGNVFTKHRPEMSGLIVKMLDTYIHEMARRAAGAPTNYVVRNASDEDTGKSLVSPADCFLARVVIDFNLAFKNPAKGYQAPTHYWEYFTGKDVQEVLAMHEFHWGNAATAGTKIAKIPAVWLMSNEAILPGTHSALFDNAALEIVNMDTDYLHLNDVESLLLQIVPKGTVMLAGEFPQHIAIAVAKFCEKYRIIFASVATNKVPAGGEYYEIVPMYDLKK